MDKILVADDETTVRAAFVEILSGEGHSIVTARTAEEALACVEAEDPQVVILDICMPGMSGLDALARIKQVRPKLPVIVMTGQGTMETAIEATKRGAFDYQLKPFEPDEMLGLVERALQGVRLMQRHVAVDPEIALPSSDAIVGQSAAMQEVYKAIGRVAGTDATVLLRGESGTGKELVARALYQHSLRSAAPMQIVNCVAIPETLLEGELFGYERGAFTGAHARRIGKLEQADGGTVFLDEIGDIPLGVQAKLLRVLQVRSLERLGSNQTIRVDVRVLTATNRDLEKAIAQGTFREDLYHRLNVVTIRLPPLRERREDIPRLTNYFLDRYSAELRLDKPPLADEAWDLLRSHHWPGNVRELEHCIHRALIFTQGHPIQADDIRQALPERSAAGTSIATSNEEAIEKLVQEHLKSHAGPKAHELLLDRVERALVAEALQRSRGNQTQAARLLGLARPTLHAKVQRLGLRSDTDGTL